MSTSPPAGWFDDPERPGQLRYWDGSSWTEHRAPHPSAATGDGRLSDIGVWFDQTFRHLWARRGPVGIVACLLVVASYLGGIAVAHAVDGIAFVDRPVDPWTGVDGGRIAAVAGVIVVLAIVSVFGYVVVSHQVVWSRVGEPTPLATSARAALAGFPRLVGWGIVWGVAWVVAFAVLVAVTALVPVLGAILILASIPLSIWLSVKAVFALPAAAAPIGGMGLPRAAMAVSASGRFRAVFGRLILLVLAVIGISIAMAIPLGLIGDDTTVDDAVVIEDGELVAVDFGELVEASGYGTDPLNLIGAIPQVFTTLVAISGISVLYAEVHGRPRTRH